VITSPLIEVQITRLLTLNDAQFTGCVSAFIDSLLGELNAAALYLKKLEGQPKGAAFAFEMALDNSRYGALIVLDRWATLVQTFGPHLESARFQALVDETPARVQTAENLLQRTNNLIDATAQYSNDVVTTCLLAWQSLTVTFAEERQAAERMQSLGPMQPRDFREARQIFIQDLASR
jgi:hypothetical protein